MVSYNHEAVMVKEVINNLIFDKNGSYVDCTFGMGGHSAAILNSLDKQGNKKEAAQAYQNALSNTLNSEESESMLQMKLDDLGRI